jgi:hypothetical protein
MGFGTEMHASASHRDRGYIGLSFSGGGYRATAFSLGSMALLHDLGLLSKARVMSSVSGGSLALAALLCAKAGCRPRQESDFRFYDRFWDPLMQALESESLADAFVRLPLLLQGEKVILHAADATQRLLNTLLGEEACLGNEAINGMLREHAISPDYVFFNASNIVSLDLFRFGIQRGADVAGPRGEPVYVLNRYYLQAEGGSVEANELYHHARNLRLGDCVAASFAFPGGFEPLIFPHDYYRPGHSPAGAEGARLACEHFSSSLICDRQPYVAFLDGGLYDNLGLASVEDIRRFLLRRSRDLKLQASLASEAGRSHEREQPIHYVIATDVDNIQPGIGFYDEPSLDRQLAAASAASHAPHQRGQGQGGQPLDAITRMAATLPWLALGALGALLGTLVLGVLLGLGLAGAWPWRLVATVVGLAVLLVALGGAVRILRCLRRSLATLRRLWRRLPRWLGGGARPPQQAAAAPTWRQRMGLSREFDRQGVDNNLLSWLVNAVLGVLRAPDRTARLDDLRAGILERRLGQLLPAFNGYLKRTRSLTYGYLQQTYDGAAPGDDPPSDDDARCHLIRNMIFELIPGPDVDPSFASNLITLPVQNYRRQEVLEPMAPIMRKLRHADYARDLLDRLAGRPAPSHTGSQPPPQRRMELALEMLLQDRDLERSIDDLHLNQAAHLWSWLTANLEFDCRECRPGEPNATIRALLQAVRAELNQAREAANQDHPGVAEPLLRQRCAVKLGEDATSYSWIPLICEMATNLNTTLWVRGFRWYRPNQLEEQRIVAVGGWFVEPPQEKSPMPLLDLGGLNAPAAAITALAGYINTAFNLLEFFYATLGSSDPARKHLVSLLSDPGNRVESWPEDRREDLADLPFVLRDRTLTDLRRISQRRPSQLPPGQLALLEPWLMAREGYPDAWRESVKPGGR